MTNRFTPRDNRKARGSHDEHIQLLMGKLAAPILTVSYDRHSWSAGGPSPS